MLASRIIVPVAALLLFIAAACVSAEAIDCLDGMDPFVELNVYFGQETGDGQTIADSDWQTFLEEIITPRFPDGLTVLDAHGQRLDTDEGRLYRESTRVLNVLVPADATESGINAVREISDAYKARFDQQAVFHTALPACAAIY